MIPVIINNRDRLTWPRAMVDDIRRMDNLYPIIVDNASTYPPLLEWYSSKPCMVIALTENIGPRAPWVSGTVGSIKGTRYIVTDPDLDISEVPSDVLSYLERGLLKSGIWKVGLSLKIDDLPNSAIAGAVKNWEGKYWNAPTADGYYVAPVDTTFALYSRKDPPTDIGGFLNSALRAATPYEARHLPWYLTADNITEEEKHYLSTSRCGTSGSFWNQTVRNTLGV